MQIKKNTDHIELNQDIQQNMDDPNTEATASQTFDIADPLYESARNTFVVKVYTVLGIQLLVTAAFVVITIAYTAIQDFLKYNTWLFILMTFTTLVVLILLCILLNKVVCKKEICERYPYNLLALTIFTLAQSYCVATICARYEPQSVAIAAAVTAVCTVSITLYVKFSNTTFSTVKSIIASLGVSFFSSLMVITILNSRLQIPFVSFMMALVLALVYPLYLIYDTKMILDSEKHHLTLDQYVLASLYLYIDIIGIFLQILRIIGNRR